MEELGGFGAVRRCVVARSLFEDEASLDSGLCERRIADCGRSGLYVRRKAEEVAGAGGRIAEEAVCTEQIGRKRDCSVFCIHFWRIFKIFGVYDVFFTENNSGWTKYSVNF